MKNIVELGQFINKRTSDIDDLYHEMEHPSPVRCYDYYTIENTAIEFISLHYNGDNESFRIDIDLYTSDSWKEELTETILEKIKASEELSEKIKKRSEEREYQDYIKLKNKFENGGN